MPRQRIGRTVCVRLARREPYTENAEAGEQHVAASAEIVDPKVADVELGFETG